MKDVKLLGISKVTLVVAKVGEILHWIGVVSMIILLICSLVKGEWLDTLLNQNIKSIGTTFSSYGFEVSIAGVEGTVNLTAVTVFAIGAVMILSLFAMVFRNTYLILKTAEGKTWFSKGETPFQGDIVRMLREIGIFLIAVPFVSYFMGIVARAVIGVESAEISVNFVSAVLGLLIFCLSRFFTYGTKLEKDVEGLL